MSVTFVKRSVLPAAVKGKVGSSQITVTGNGQMVLSSIATKHLGVAKQVVMAFDGMKVYLFLDGAKAIAKVADQDKIKLNFSKKGGTCGFSGSAIFKAMTDFGATAKYEYAASGNQNFPVTFDEKNQALIFELPVGKLAPRPVVKREKKVKPASIKAEAGSTDALVEPELVLEPA